MEKYKLQQRLGKGAQGSVYLTESKDDASKKYVLKKVECEDETEANKAFMEAMALQKLSVNPYICGYKEFFVTWDKEDSAMFVCIVMDYYKMGDLDRVLKDKRKAQEKIEEVVLKKWFGQMIEAMAFVHDKKMMHRDLKPSNIFMSDDLNCVIGDFGVSTVMDDARTKARTTVGSMHWMAPEVLDQKVGQAYDERSDIWSLGCILLEMATTKIRDHHDITTQLCEIKTSPDVLEEVLEEIAEKKLYSPELCQVIRLMLRRHFPERPRARELIELPFLQECLRLFDSDHTKKESKQDGSKSPTPLAIPKDKGVPGIIKWMKENSDDDEKQTTGLSALLGMIGAKAHPVKEDIKFLTENMRKHVSNVGLQTLTCQVLTKVAADVPKPDAALYTREVISPIVLAMKSHASSAKLQSSATQLLMTLSANEGAAAVIGKLGGVQDVLGALRTYDQDVEIVTNCLGALWSLAVDENNAKILTEERGLKDVAKAMDDFSDSVDLIEAACSALWSLSLEEENIEIMLDLHIIGHLLTALQKHKTEARCVKNAFMALASIVEEDESSAYELLEGEDGIPGMDTVIEAYKCNSNNEEVTENFATCVTELATYDDLRDELKAKNVKELFADAKLKFATSPDVVDAINQALLSLNESIGADDIASAPPRPSSRARPRSAKSIK